MVDDTSLALRPPRHRVDRRFVTWRTLDAAAWAVGVFGVLGALFWFVEPTRPWLTPLLWVLVPTYLVNITVMPTLRYRVHRWEVTDDTVYAVEGWITRKWQVVPVSRIQTIDTEAGPIQRNLGIATLTVTTASSEGKISIEGIDETLARQTVEHLRRITAVSPGDAT